MTRDLFGETYPTTLADPPWPERGGGVIKRGADRHYPLLDSPAEIVAAMRASPIWRPAEDAHLYLWVTNNYMPWGLDVAARLGFAFKTIITWAKPRAGIGQYFRGQTEHLLFCARGAAMPLRREHTERRDISTLLVADVPTDEHGKRIHSRKPDESYRLIEAASPGPYAEIFARRQWGPAWSVWGYDAPESAAT